MISIGRASANTFQFLPILIPCADTCRYWYFGTSLLKNDKCLNRLSSHLCTSFLILSLDWFDRKELLYTLMHWRNSTHHTEFYQIFFHERIIHRRNMQFPIYTFIRGLVISCWWLYLSKMQMKTLSNPLIKEMKEKEQ